VCVWYMRVCVHHNTVQIPVRAKASGEAGKMMVDVRTS